MREERDRKESGVESLHAGRTKGYCFPGAVPVSQSQAQGSVEASSQSACTNVFSLFLKQDQQPKKRHGRKNKEKGERKIYGGGMKI